MQILHTRRTIDPNWEQHIKNLELILKFAGSPKRLSKLLGVNLNTVYSWGRSGQISPIGALLVEQSKELSFLGQGIPQELLGDS